MRGEVGMAIGGVGAYRTVLGSMIAVTACGHEALMSQ